MFSASPTSRRIAPALDGNGAEDGGPHASAGAFERRSAFGVTRKSTINAPGVHLMWHASRHDGPAVAKAYARDYGALWHDTPDAVPFLRWLHCHPRVMSERAAVLEWSEALFWEGDGGLRQTVATARQNKLDAIDDALSERIVAARADRDGHVVLPWVHSGARSARSVT